MFYRAVIIGILILPCFFSLEIQGECLIFSDPNGYIDNPDTLDNGQFECGDPNLTEYYLTLPYNFVPPIYWERTPNPSSLPDCYASLIYRSADPNIPAFIPPEYRGDNEDKWTISAPYEGDSFVVLSTGGFGSVNGTSVKGACISQEIFLSPGDTIIGAYFFGAGDYTPFNDYGRIYLQPADSNDYPNPRPEFTIAECNVEDVGSFLSTAEWVPFVYNIEPNQIGPYYLHCEVVDSFDTKLTSYFAIDNLRICHNGLSPADLNYDCNVNLEDYCIVSQAWLSFCPDIFDPNTMDPNDITDPNMPCQLADIDNNGYVDPNDLIIMSEDWLF